MSLLTIQDIINNTVEYKMKVPFYRPALPPYEKIEPEFRKAYDTGMLAPGEYTMRLKSALQDYLQVKHVIPFSNCSDGMMCLCGYIKSRSNKNQIIIPSFTFAATWQAVDWNGMTSVICDVDENGLLNPKEVANYLSEHSHEVAAILAVHMFGQPAYISELSELALKYNTLLIFDAAHGMGSRLDDKRLGNNGFAEVFSMGITKTLSCGEGGFITTADNQLAEAMEKASMHGHGPGGLDVELKSLNGRIQEINSIIAYHGLTYLDDVITERQHLAGNYRNALEEIAECEPCKSHLVPIIPRRFTRSSHKDYACFLKHCNSLDYTKTNGCSERDHLANFLEENGVAVKKYYYPDIANLSVLSRPQDCGGNTIIHSSSIGNKLADNCLSLPFFNGMTKEQQEHVIGVLSEWAKR
jgi:dTDP-4-amino-4,6-dideoxygalactose transaminase